MRTTERISAAEALGSAFTEIRCVAVHNRTASRGECCPGSPAKKRRPRAEPAPRRCPRRRTFKLGKKKRSYNQARRHRAPALSSSRLAVPFSFPQMCLALKPRALQVAITFVHPTDASLSLIVAQAVQRPAGTCDFEPGQALVYDLRLPNGLSLSARLHLVYSVPVAYTQPTDGASGSYSWEEVTRASCNKGCCGPVLAAIQRLGRQGRMQNGGASASDADGAYTPVCPLP